MEILLLLSVWYEVSFTNRLPLFPTSFLQYLHEKIHRYVLLCKKLFGLGLSRNFLMNFIISMANGTIWINQPYIRLNIYCVAQKSEYLVIIDLVVL